MMESGSNGANVCKCTHHHVWGVFAVVFGLLFLGGNWGWWGWNVVSLGWPILVVLAGLFKLTEGKCKCC